MARPHTPIKRELSYIYTDDRVPAPELKQLVINEVAGCVFQNLPDFLDTIFPVAQLANEIQTGQDRLWQFLRELVNAGLLEPSRWKNFPDDGCHEIQLLDPFVEIFNAITKLCGSEDRIKWRDEHSKPPQSACGELLRPDILAMLNHPVNSPVHWHNVLLPVEVKRRNQPQQALPQLITYARNILREQWNRRFTFGFICAGREFQVWLFDRSGAIGSPTINFHQVRTSLVAVSTSLMQVFLVYSNPWSSLGLLQG
jgi:hypothetical protein